MFEALKGMYKALQSIVLSLVVTALCSAAAADTANRQIDPGLVGDWVGERAETPQCQYLSWAISLLDDGTYDLLFYKDSGRTILYSWESGVWWAEESIFYTQLPDVMDEPNSYSYVYATPDVVKFKMEYAHDTSECQGDYRFIQYRAD